MRAEDKLQITICDYIKLAYPDVIFHQDGSGGVTSIGMAVRAKRMRSEDNIPDMFIAEPKGNYCGLYLEIKSKTPFLKDGITLSRDKHIQDQNEMLIRLEKKGYMAQFIWSFDDAKKLIDTYMRFFK